MRIIAGKLRSRQIKTLIGNSTRPTTDKVKEALFNAIGPYFDGGVMLDMFSGSGSIAFEALSRGMNFAVCIDSYNEAVKIINENIKNLELDKVTKLVKSDYQRALRLINDQYKFDLVYIDPPYHYQDIEKMISLLNKYTLLNVNAIVVVETKKESQLNEQYDEIIKYKESVYGITKLTYYKKEER